MTEALKTDWLEQAKREIEEQWHAYTQKHNVRASGHYAREIKGNWAEELLIAERARNLELREALAIYADHKNWDSAQRDRFTYNDSQDLGPTIWGYLTAEDAMRTEP